MNQSVKGEESPNAERNQSYRQLVELAELAAAIGCPSELGADARISPPFDRIREGSAELPALQTIRTENDLGEFHPYR